MMKKKIKYTITSMYEALTELGKWDVYWLVPLCPDHTGEDHDSRHSVVE